MPKEKVRQPLGIEEQLKRSDEIARLEIEKDKVKETKKAANAAFNEQIKDYEERISGYAKEIVEGVEIEVSVRRDYTSDGYVEIVRLDTGEVIERREMTDEDKQIQLFGDLENQMTDLPDPDDQDDH